MRRTLALLGLLIMSSACSNTETPGGQSGAPPIRTEFPDDRSGARQPRTEDFEYLLTWISDALTQGYRGAKHYQEEDFVRLSDEEQRRLTDAISNLLESDDAEVRRRAAVTLNRYGDGRGVPVMGRDVLSLPDDNARGTAAVALRVSKDRRAIPYLAKAIDDPDPYVRSIALEALGELGAVAHIDSIAGHLDDREMSGDCLKRCPAESACYALGVLGSLQAAPRLIEALRRPRESWIDNAIASRSIQALQRIAGDSMIGDDPDAWEQWLRTRSR